MAAPRSAARRAHRLRDFHNYLVTAKTIDGDWSDPVYLNSSGFDPSLFHDDDGRKWFVNMLWDHRPGQNRFAGIVAQEYSPQRKEADRRAGEYLQRHAAGPDRSAASLQARRLVLSADGGRRHRLEPCRHHGAVTRTCWGPTNCIPTPTSSAPATGPTRRCSAPAMPTWWRRQDGETYMVYLCGRPLKKSRPLHPGPRNRHPEDAMARRLALYRRRAGPAAI